MKVSYYNFSSGNVKQDFMSTPSTEQLCIPTFTTPLAGEMELLVKYINTSGPLLAIKAGQTRNYVSLTKTLLFFYTWKKCNKSLTITIIIFTVL